MFDGTEKLVGAYADPEVQYQWYLSTYNNHRAVSSPGTIEIITSNYVGEQANVKVKLTLTESIAASGIVCHLVLTENHVSSNGTSWGYVERLLSTKTVTISSAAQSEEYTETFNLNGSWNKNNLGLAVIVQDLAAKTVLQGNAAALVSGNSITPASLGRVKALYN